MHIQPGQLQWIVLPQVLVYGRQAEEVFRNAKESGELPRRNQKGRKSGVRG